MIKLKAQGPKKQRPQKILEMLKFVKKTRSNLKIFFSADKSKINKITPNVFSSWMIHLWKLQVRRHVYLLFCHYFPNLNCVFIILWHKVGEEELTTSSKASPQLSDFTFEVVLYMYFQNSGNRYLLSIHILTRKKN